VLPIWLACNTASSCNANTATAVPTTEEHPVLAWLRAQEGGYVNPKVVFTEGGLFATSEIKKGEAVFTIPTNALLKPFDEEDDSMCETAHRLVLEYRRSEESSYAPFVKYVFETFPHKTVPMGWSEQGKQLVRDMVGSQLEPQEFGSGSFDEACEGYDDYLLEEDLDKSQQIDLLEAAWRIVCARGWHHVLVPVFDMANHRNNQWRNIDRDTDLEDVDQEYRIIALKNIEKGGQLYNSYNQCRDVTCHDIDMFYVTPQIFGDYGFVEQYPHRFDFWTGQEDEEDDFGLVFEVDEIDDHNRNDVFIKWLKDEPNPDQIDWLKKQHKRLQRLENDVTERAKVLSSKHEADMAMSYYRALKNALNLAITATNNDSKLKEEERVEEL